MAQESAQTIAYPADRAEAPYTDISQELTGREWLHSVLPGIGLAVAVFCVPPLAQMAIYGTWSAVDLRVALLCGGALTGCLLVVRYVTDVAKLIANQVYIKAVLEPQAAEAARLFDACEVYAAEIERLRRKVTELRTQPAPQPVATPESAPIPDDVWGDVDPYPELRIDMSELSASDETAMAASGENLTDDESAAYAIIENAETFGSISRNSCRENSGLTKAPWLLGVTFLDRVGAAQKDAGGGWSLIVDVTEAYRLVGLAIDERQQKRQQWGERFTPA